MGCTPTQPWDALTDITIPRERDARPKISGWPHSRQHLEERRDEWPYYAASFERRYKDDAQDQ